MAQVATKIVQGLRKHVPLIKFRGKTQLQRPQSPQQSQPPPQQHTQPQLTSSIDTKNTSTFSSTPPPSLSKSPAPRIPKRRPLTEEEIKIIEVILKTRIKNKS